MTFNQLLISCANKLTFLNTINKLILNAKINLNNEEFVFNDPTELRNTVFNKIISKQQISSPFSLDDKIDINTGKLTINNQELSQFIVDGNNSDMITVYKIT